ncbi:MAG TPA: cation-efflux pump [Betaproteobacteria bacterium]|nr:cation-efflux pump [Betaproteobacteria bacterium]
MALLSITASLATLLLKFAAYFLTGSVSLFSDAAESLVNLAAGLMAFFVLTVAARPADENHAYGHDKAEYFSSGVEGALIIVAAAAIGYAAVNRLLHPQPLSSLGIGLSIAAAAAAVNYGAARAMLKVARQYDSITLEADAKHLLTDVWTSAGVIGGLLVVSYAPPGWRVLDPLMALAMALNIIHTGVSLLRRSLDGLMDIALPPEEVVRIEALIRREASPDSSFHALRTRKAGPRRFIEFHLLVPGGTTVRMAHGLCDRIEDAIAQAFANTSVIIHTEPDERPFPSPLDAENG